MVGIAAGRFNYGNDCYGIGPAHRSPPAPGFAFDITDTAGNGKDNAIVGGVAGGLGIDWALTPGMYLRGEWEYVAFAPVNGSRSNFNTGKIGAGARF
jgi:opacity protein-like surface antigen